MLLIPCSQDTFYQYERNVYYIIQYLRVIVPITTTVVTHGCMLSYLLQC